ncbi:MAG: hypothetical protein WBQ37_11075 [Candidatus Competibacter sp.]
MPPDALPLVFPMTTQTELLARAWLHAALRENAAMPEVLAVQLGLPVAYLQQYVLSEPVAI